MFPTTIWTRIHEAGKHDTAALEDFAERYRPAVLAHVNRRGFRDRGAEDICQEVFLRLLRGEVLAKADRERGRFRTLLLTVTTRVIQDHLRRRRTLPLADPVVADRLPDWDHDWAWHLTERALDRLREQGSPYFDVLVGHVSGRHQDRNKLWIARKKLAALVRNEVALTCATREDFDAELAHLAPYLRPRPRKE